MRIAAGGYEHETNTFSNIPVTKEWLDRITVWGDELYRQSKGVGCMMGGFIDEAEALGIELADHMIVGENDYTSMRQSSNW